MSRTATHNGERNDPVHIVLFKVLYECEIPKSSLLNRDTLMCSPVKTGAHPWPVVHSRVDVVG